jgi:chaperonin GroEL (HSP60 family)
MSFLPITKLDYEKAVLMTDFLTRIRNVLEQNNSLKFTPLINGYKIDFKISENQFTLLLEFKKKLKTEFIVNVFVNEIAEKAFKSVSVEDNERIIKEIF